MSELVNARNAGRDFRWQLLTTVSAWVLLAVVYGPIEAEAADQDADRPTLWIELGGQLEQMQGGQEPFAPSFVANLPDNFFSPLSVQKPLQYSIGGEAAISFEPEGSDWSLSASIRFGRSNGVKQLHQQTPNAKVLLNHVTVIGKYIAGGSYYPSRHVKFSDAKASQSESHTVLDFQAGKDVGLGMFGNHGSSVFSAGVRFAQFSSTANVNLHAEPDVRYPTAPISSFPAFKAFKYAPIRFHDYAGMEVNQRSFHGIGPALAWNGSTPFVGSPERAELTFDWGANAAILFGRQKATVRHQTVVQTYYKNRWSQAHIDHCLAAAPCSKPGYFVNSAVRTSGFGYFPGPSAHHSSTRSFNRMRSVTVPNAGGFAGLSFLYANAKVSVGYRADFFFGAMDGGIDTARKENVGFYGPFASISVGFGG
ncbi:MAG TPA: hypothetical protein VIJ62_01210 [Rhizomicrobium sp.]